MLRVTLTSGQKENALNLKISLNVDDFMKLRKEAIFQREKLYFRVKHHIYTNLQIFCTLFELTVINQSRQSALNNFSICAKMV